MLTQRQWLMAPLLAVAALLASGCEYVAPSDDIYEIGVARIGDELHVFAPLCDDERIASVEAIDNTAAAKESTFDRESTRFTYWKVAEPTDDRAARGWIVVGDDAGYQKVSVPAGSAMELPETLAVMFRINDPEAGHSVGGAFEVGRVPTYPAGTDPETVKYGYNLGAKNEERLTASEISDRSKCALDYYRS
ncbi:hypothetical protein ABNF97_29715 [Plantactinospora sp. B6F1]|uniref:hypothetical protein n=1 Tax=Plantactinospora sp. B6F1 TaxID=3158971 RepID=UPI00102B6197